MIIWDPTAKPQSTLSLKTRHFGAICRVQGGAGVLRSPGDELPARRVPQPRPVHRTEEDGWPRPCACVSLPCNASSDNHSGAFRQRQE